MEATKLDLADNHFQLLETSLGHQLRILVVNFIYIYH